MSSGVRRVLAGVTIVLALAGAAVFSSAHADQLRRAARKQAEQAVDVRWVETADALKAATKALAERALVVATIPNLGKVVEAETSQSDIHSFTKTLLDARREETWLRGPVGDDALEVAFALGDRADTLLQPVSLANELLKRQAAASVAPSASLVVFDGKPWLVAVARTTAVNLNGESGWVALGRPLSAKDLSAPAGGAVAIFVADAPKPFVVVGDTEGGDRLARRRTAMKLEDSPCCAAREVVPGVELAVFRDPKPELDAAEAEARHAMVPRFALFGGGGLVLALLLLFVRRSSDERDALLLDAQRQLRQSQEALQKLSTGAFATHAAHGLAPQVSVDDPLGSTQASAGPSRYEVVAPLGEGGMARVSVAVARGAEGFKRFFVLKRLKANHVGNQEIVNQFIDEARLGASLVHSNIVPVFDFGRDAEGYFLTQEYILGRNVDALLEASLQKRGRPLEPALVAAIGQEALKALNYAHTRTLDTGRAGGLVHRDVSPANLMVTSRGEVKLLDFGIVKSADRLTQTQDGMVKGNLFFMSPEQARAIPVDSRSDLFSLSMVMANVVLGRTLYTGTTMYELMTRAAVGPTAEDLQLVRDGAGPLAGFLTKGLAVDPAQRFQSASDMALALASAQPAAPSSELERLMTELFRVALDEERQLLAGVS